MGEAWIRPPQVKLVHDAVLAACDAADGVADGIVSDPVACRQRFDVTRLRCTGAANDQCLNDAQVRAVQTLEFAFTRSTSNWPTACANTRAAARAART